MAQQGIIDRPEQEERASVGPVAVGEGGSLGGALIGEPGAQVFGRILGRQQAHRHQAFQNVSQPGRLVGIRHDRHVHGQPVLEKTGQKIGIIARFRWVFETLHRRVTQTQESHFAPGCHQLMCHFIGDLAAERPAQQVVGSPRLHAAYGLDVPGGHGGQIVEGLTAIQAAGLQAITGLIFTQGPGQFRITHDVATGGMNTEQGGPAAGFVDGHQANPCSLAGDFGLAGGG